MRDVGYQLAEQMGLKAVQDFSGEEGTVYLLDDGRVLKITDSEIEAAILLAIADLQNVGETHPAVPMVHSVMWLEDCMNDEYLSDGEQRAVYYVIIRDDMSDIPEHSYNLQSMKEAFFDLRSAWSSGSKLAIIQLYESYPEFESEIRQVLDGLQWVADKTKSRMSDVRFDNIGLNHNGHFGLRDYGRGFLSPKLLERVRRREFTQCTFEIQNPNPSP